MPTFAAVDIGANSVRLKIARLVRGQLEVLHEDREVVRLGEAVFQTGVLASDAMAHTVQVLGRFHKSAQSYGANAVRVVATSSLRDARNSRAFIDWVRSATGWETEVISGLEEGRLIHLAVLARVPGASSSRLLLFDLGGGSCEVTTSINGEIHGMVSLPLGAVRLTREFLKHDPPKKKELERMREFITEQVMRFEDRAAAANAQMVIATSGTAAALAGVHTSRRNSRPATVPVAAVTKLSAELATLNATQRATLPGIGTRRAEIIVAGATVFSCLLSRFGLPSFRYSSLGLRDGVLTQMAADYDQHTKFRERLESQRRNALYSLARHFKVSIKCAEHVRDLSLKLFHGLSNIHQLPAEYENWLIAAAMLYDVGAYVNRAGRRRHTYYLISNSEIFGYTIHQREVIGAIARYMGKSRPTPDARPMRPLSSAERELVPKAIVLLRLARALDQGRRGAVTDLRVRVQDARVTLELTTKRGGADLELWAVNKERAYFREVFGRVLFTAVS